MKAYGLSPMNGYEKPPSTEKSYKNLRDSAINYIQKTVLQDKATAIIVYGHLEAINLLQVAQALNISVPEKLSIICFCDQHASNIMSPGMSFIDLMCEEMGQAAAELIINQLEHYEQRKPEIIKLPEQLIIRDTTSKPPKD
jgi:LacI family transcriptional regulator